MAALALVERMRARQLEDMLTPRRRADEALRLAQADARWRLSQTLELEARRQKAVMAVLLGEL